MSYDFSALLGEGVYVESTSYEASLCIPNLRIFQALEKDKVLKRVPYSDLPARRSKFQPARANKGTRNAALKWYAYATQNTGTMRDHSGKPGFWLKCIARIGLSGIFVAAGIEHLLHPQVFIAIVPPGFGNPAWDVWVSAWLEILGGCGLLVPRLRRYAFWGLILLLIAVWPANWYMALSAEHFRSIAPAWVLWLRVPLQILIIRMIFFIEAPRVHKSP